MVSVLEQAIETERPRIRYIRVSQMLDYMVRGY
jgi:hypothetical protein